MCIDKQQLSRVRGLGDCHEMRPEVVWFFLPFLEDVLLLLHRFLKGPSLNTNSVYIVENSVKDCLTSLVLMSGYGHRIASEVKSPNITCRICVLLRIIQDNVFCL